MLGVKPTKIYVYKALEKRKAPFQKTLVLWSTEENIPKMRPPVRPGREFQQDPRGVCKIR